MCGPDAEKHNEQMAGAVASLLGVAVDSVMVCTTGVIGVPFPIDRVTQATKKLVEGLESDPKHAAEAIRTTDTCEKVASRELFLGGSRIRILGIAKGSGMVHPNMATVLGFLLTDAAISPAVLDEALRDAVDETFNMVSVDRDTSTNDTVLALANGLAENAPIDSLASEQGKLFAAALLEVCGDLARAVAKDGEGARKLVTSHVVGASSKHVARELARSVIESNLVKAALFGADPGFGRVLAALGARAHLLSEPLDPKRLGVVLQGVRVFEAGKPVTFEADALRARLRQDEVRIEIAVGDGPGEATAWGCDLSYDYVRINADYAAVLVDSPGGPVHRDARLDTKTPELKTEVLVSALRYIERFSGTRAVICYGPTTLARRDLALRLAEDVRLLAAVGLRAILVQGGDPSEVVVSSLARAGVRAVGLSGSDGNLLKMREGAFDDESTTVQVDTDVIETLLAKGYIPVVMPALTELDIPSSPRVPGGSVRGLPVDAEAVAAELAVACSARKLIYLCEAPGILSEGLLVSELSAEELDRRARDGSLDPSMRSRAVSVVRALAGGVETVHLIDERVPHNVVAELFTENGVGTMVR
jgi:acetylglutamate kinase